MKSFLISGCLFCVALLAGCVTMGGGGGGSGSLNAQVERHEQQIQGLLSQVGRVEQVLPGQAEMWSQMQTMRQELNALTGKLDDLRISGGGAGDPGLRDRVSRLENIVRQMAAQLSVNVDSLNASDAGGSRPYYPPPESAASATAASAAQSADRAAAIYDAGIKSFDQRRYKEAVSSFKDFYAAYPDHKLAGNAHFWEGESWFQLKDYARAALAYQEVIAKFPGSQKLQSAMLKQGMALSGAGKKQAARERLNELVTRYPSSPEATRAKQLLADSKF
ncbi:MAG: tol-pal system protein YbgF [Desulfovibrio sp.]|jgi:tol-pal system protein YbgF|nr:tol-pal system protein YbgF [Desulfovibrio sp.]